jgi:hypothetical protein
MKVIDETLRLVNISFVSFRQATKDVFVNGTLRALPSFRNLTYSSFRSDH